MEDSAGIPEMNPRCIWEGVSPASQFYSGCLAHCAGGPSFFGFVWVSVHHVTPVISQCDPVLYAYDPCQHYDPVIYAYDPCQHYDPVIMYRTPELHNPLVM